jgi:uncharacterized protein (DUF3820 family)
VNGDWKGSRGLDDDSWAVWEAQDYLEFYQIAQELLRVLPDEVIDWLKRGHPEEELARMYELMAALPLEDMDAFTDALLALGLYHERHGHHVIEETSRHRWLRGLL